MLNFVKYLFISFFIYFSYLLGFLRIFFVPKFNKKLVAKKKAVSLGFKTIADYKKWFYSSHSLQRTKHFLNMLVKPGNWMIKYVYFLDNFKKINLILRIIKIFFVTFFLFFSFLKEGFIQWKHVLKFYFVFILFYITKIPFFLYILLKFGSLLIFNLFYAIYLFFLTNYTFLKNFLSFSKKSLRMYNLLRKISINNTTWTSSYKKIEQDEKEIENSYDFMNEFFNPCFFLEGGRKERIDLLRAVYKRKKGWYKEFKKVRRFEKHEFFLNYLFFNFFTWLSFFFYDLLYFSPVEKTLNILIYFLNIIRIFLNLYRRYWHTAALPLFLTNFIFFFFRFWWISILTTPIPYGYMWSLRQLRKMKWLKLHSHCWIYWVGYWRMLFILRYTFHIPANYYRQPGSYGDFINLPYSQRKNIFRYYFRYVPYYGFFACFIAFHTCMFWFPPTWSHSAVYIGPIQFF